MPNYDYSCLSCKETWEEFHTIANRETPLGEPCPKCGCATVQRAYNTPIAVGDPFIYVQKVPDGFKRVLKNVKRRNPGNTIPDYD